MAKRSICLFKASDYGGAKVIHHLDHTNRKAMIENYVFVIEFRLGLSLPIPRLVNNMYH